MSIIKQLAKILEKAHGHPDDCPYNCGELVKRNDEQLDLFESDDKNTEEL